MVRRIESFAPWMKLSKSNVQECIPLSSQANQPGLMRHLLKQVTGPVDRVIISGAFFDQDLDFLKQVQQKLQPQEVIVGIDPKTVQIPSQASQFAGVRFVNCSSFGNKNTDKESGYLHAKMMLIEQVDGKVILVSGSANSSAPAWLDEGYRQNTEMVLYRQDEAGKQAALEMGIFDMVNLPNLTNQDWLVVKENTPPDSKKITKSKGKVGLAIASDKGLIFKGMHNNWPTKILCELLSERNNVLEQCYATRTNQTYSISTSPEIQDKTSWLRCLLDNEEKRLFLVHHERIIAEQSRTGTQRNFSDALASLSCDTPNIETLIKCVDKILFSKANIIDSTNQINKPSEGNDGGSKQNRGVEEPSLSIDLSQTRKSIKKYRLRYSDDLSFLFETLLYHLRVDLSGQNDLPGQDSMGRTEEQTIGTDDEEDKSTIEESQRILKVCHTKIKTLVNRIVSQFKALREGKVEFEDVVVRLTGVLALLRHLRECDGGKVVWIPKGQTAFPLKLRKVLFHAITQIFFDGKYNLLYPSEENKNLFGTDELARMKGMILWLAWDCDMKLQLKKNYAENADEEERIRTNGILITLAQFSAGDETVFYEAQKSIAPFDTGNQNWLKWILNTQKKLTILSSNQANFKAGTEAHPGCIAYNPKLPEMGYRFVQRVETSIVDIVSYLVFTEFLF